MFCLLDVKKAGIDVSIAIKQVSDPEPTEQVLEQRQLNEDPFGELFPLNYPPQC